MKIKQLIKYWIYRFKWYTARYINYSSPVHLDIELSTRCNLNCEFCFRQDCKYEQKDIDVELAITLLDQAKAINVKSVKFNWRGEATIHSKLLIIFLYAKKLCLYTMLNTNLALDYGNNLLAKIADIDNLKISIDSMNKETYEKIRKGADFLKVISNLRLLDFFRRTETNKREPIVINRRTSELTTESNEQFICQLNQFGKFKYDIRPAMPRNQKQIYQDKLKERKRKYCAQPSRRMVVDVDGNVWMCCVSYNQDKALWLGNVKEKSLKECWDSSKRALLVQSLKRNIFNNNTCKNCTSGDAYK